MKKIICFLGSLIAGIIILCVPSFAADSSTVKFDDYFSPNDIILGGLTSGQYIEVYDSETRVYTATHDYAFETLKYWGAYCRVKFKPQGISSNTRLTFDMKVDIYLDDKITNINNIYPKIQVKDGGSWYKAGSHTVLTQWNSTNKTISMLYKVDYVFKSDTDSIMFTFDIPSHNQTNSIFREIRYRFPKTVSNFYLGSNNNPNLPNYSDPNEDFGGTLNDYTDKENAVIDSTEEGKEIFSNSMTWVFDALGYVSISLSAIGRAFEFIFVELYWLHYLVRFSLAIGLVAYVLNIGATIFKNVSRKKGGED